MSQLDSKLRELWYMLFIVLSPIQNHFRNQLNYMFSIIQKKVNLGVPISSSDISIYVDKFSHIYTGILSDISGITMRRVEGEIGNRYPGNYNNIIVNRLCKDYICLYVKDLSEFVIKDVVNSIKLSKYKISKYKDYKKYINYYFDTVCKSNKSKTVAFNEVYRYHNYLYYNLMKMLNMESKICINKKGSVFSFNKHYYSIDDDIEGNPLLSPFPPMFSGDSSILLIFSAQHSIVD